MKRSFNKVRSIYFQPKSTKKNEGTLTDANPFSPTSKFHYWYGEDDSDGSTFNYIQDRYGNIQGSLIDMRSKSVIQISIQKDGSPIVTIKHSCDFRPEIDPPNKDEDLGQRELTTDITKSTAKDHQPIMSYLRTNNSSSEKNKKQEEATRKVEPFNDDGGNLDVMVVWTSKAECKSSNLPEGCTLNSSTEANMEGLIRLAIQETNTAYELSGVQTKLFLAHSYRHPTFTENDISMSDTLDALQEGNIPGIQENRTAYGADIVAMIVDDAMFCGIAFMGPRIDRMYSVITWSCATGYFSFGHEIGHNLGLNHDRGTSYNCHSKKYYFGYRDPQARFRTIMAYNCRSGQCDNNPGGDCTRIQRFSNPHHTFNGLPVGNAKNDNVRKINNVRFEVAQYFPHVENGPSILSVTAAPSTFPSKSPESSTNASSIFPSTFPSSFPSSFPSTFPSGSSTSPPSSKTNPSTVSSESPTSFPPSKPSKPLVNAPSAFPSILPSGFPTSFPSSKPSEALTIVSSTFPSTLPSGSPTMPQSLKPSEALTQVPSTFPSTFAPTGSPSLPPSSKPSESPNNMPSALPTQAPTLSPSSKLPSSCNDSPLEFLYQQRFLTCATVGSLGLCADTDIQIICRATCGTCSSTSSDSRLIFKFYHTKKEEIQTKGCDIIANNPSVRCTFYGVSDTCHATCRGYY